MGEFFFTFNGDGALATRLIAGLNPIPADALPVDAKVWHQTAQETDGRWFLESDGSIRKRPFPAPSVTAEMLCSSIDAAADAARKNVAGDPLRAVEYERSAAEAQAFKQAGYPSGAVPRGVAAWAIEGRTPRQAADNIIAEAVAYTEVLYRLREMRLQAKESIRGHMAENDVAAAQQVLGNTLLEIQNLIAGIGNAGS
ncbi:MAG: phage tail protein [Pseudomonas sp.]